jgi:hypothetical protein
VPSTDLIDRANSSWWYEIGKAQWFLSRAEVFAGLWGMIATIAIVRSRRPG